MNVIHGTVDLGSSLSNNINSEEKEKRISQLSKVRTNEPTYSQNSPTGQDIESTFYDYFQNDSHDEENQFGNQQGAALEEGKHEQTREQGTSSGGHSVPGPRVHFNQSEAGHGPGFNSSRFPRWEENQTNNINLGTPGLKTSLLPSRTQMDSKQRVLYENVR